MKKIILAFCMLSLIGFSAYSAAISDYPGLSLGEDLDRIALGDNIGVADSGVAMVLDNKLNYTGLELFGSTNFYGKYFVNRKAFSNFSLYTTNFQDFLDFIDDQIITRTNINEGEGVSIDFESDPKSITINLDTNNLVDANPWHVPVGGIIMWTDYDPPDGYEICDGQNGTPDLRETFVVGLADSGTFNTLGASGGNNEKKLESGWDVQFNPSTQPPRYEYRLAGSRTKTNHIPTHIHDSSQIDASIQIETSETLHNHGYITKEDPGHGNIHFKSGLSFQFISPQPQVWNCAADICKVGLEVGGIYYTLCSNPVYAYIWENYWISETDGAYNRQPFPALGTTSGDLDYTWWTDLTKDQITGVEGGYPDAASVYDTLPVEERASLGGLHGHIANADDLEHSHEVSLDLDDVALECAEFGLKNGDICEDTANTQYILKNPSYSQSNIPTVPPYKTIVFIMRVR